MSVLTAIDMLLTSRTKCALEAATGGSTGTSQVQVAMTVEEGSQVGIFFTVVSAVRQVLGSIKGT